MPTPLHLTWETQGEKRACAVRFVSVDGDRTLLAIVEPAIPAPSPPTVPADVTHRTDVRLMLSDPLPDGGGHVGTTCVMHTRMELGKGASLETARDVATRIAETALVGVAELLARVAERTDGSAVH